MTSASALIVPIEVSALVVSRGPVTYLRQSMDYEALEEWRSPAPGPFSYGGDDAFASRKANQGVYVLWTLPSGLRRSTARSDGSAGFPLVPNRWLVTRLLQTGEAGSFAPPVSVSWVVQSDALGPGCTSAYLAPGGPTPEPTRIGRRTTITAAEPWREPADVPTPFLSAVAEGNPSFAAFQPFNANVFSIFDDFETLGVPAGVVSYSVVGWYADPRTDVLAAPHEPTSEAFRATLDELGWRTDLEGGRVTRTSLYSGTADGVPWTPGVLPPPPFKGDADPQVSIGGTSIDAVAAFAHSVFAQEEGPAPEFSPEQAADLLSAFLLDITPLLDRPGARSQLTAAIRDGWFESAGSGTAWVVTDEASEADRQPSLQSTVMAEAQWLSQLNREQERLTAVTRALIAVQRDLFGLWWKSRAAEVYEGRYRRYPAGTSAVAFSEAITRLAGDAARLLDEQHALADLVPNGADAEALARSIADYAQAHGLEAGRELKPVSGARFWSPVDPVVAISNTEHELALDPSAIVECRWEDDLVDALDVRIGAESTVTITSHDAGQAMPEIPWDGLPGAARPIAVEAFLLNPAVVAQLTEAAGRALSPSELELARKSIAEARIPAGHGSLPAIRSAYPWTPPWKPLYLDWQISWFPVPFREGDADSWQFDGTDYVMCEAAAVPQPERIEGRAVLTPAPAAILNARLQASVREEPGGPIAAALGERQGVAGEWDLLSQRLSGLGARLAGWEAVPAEHPGARRSAEGRAIGPLVGGQAGYPPRPTDASGRGPSTDFEGMRSGQFAITRLAVVDAFGQVREVVLEPRGSDHPYPHRPDGTMFEPILGEGFVPRFPIERREPGRFAELSPRVLQPLRLDVDLVDGPERSPIAGWVLPSHLDRSLTAYDTAGTALGALRATIDTTGRRTVSWDPAPGSPWPALPAPSAEAGPLLSMLRELRARGADALDGALGAIDESLWAIDPSGAGSDAFLTTVIGRPLALVTVELSLELESQPWTSTDWPATFAPKPPRMMAYAFDVRLGDGGDPNDGVIGYFVGSDYATLHCTHLPAGPPPEPGGYLELIEPGAYVKLGLRAEQDAGAATPITLLVDPRAEITARCGLAPTKVLTVPPSLVDDGLARVNAMVRSGPALVTMQPAADTQAPDAVLLPPLAERRGTLSWAERAPGPTSWIWHAVASVDDTASLPDTPPTLREGYLVITGGTDE